jgi:predicted metalloprotease
VRWPRPWLGFSDFLNVTPSFAYYDDYDGPNAFASAKKRVAGTDGMVLFGQRFLKKLMASPEAPDATVAGVCAHEFGHILQYKLGLDKDLSEGQPTVKRVELNADFFAGYFAGVRKRESPKFNAAVIALTQFNSGDNMVKNPAHHGTPAERGKAIVKGYQTGHDDRKPLLDAIKIGVEYVTANF